MASIQGGVAPMTSATTAARRLPPVRTTVRLEHSRELLAVLPHQLGYHPADSVALVAVGPGGRVGLTVRLDLPDVLSPAGDDLLHRAVRHLADDGAREVVVVVYADEPDPRDAGRALRLDRTSAAARVAAAVRTAVADLGPVTVWCVADGRYAGLDCRDPACCPPGGRPVADLVAGHAAARVLGRRRSVADRREDVGAVTPAGAGPRRAAAAARSRWADARLRCDRRADVLAWRRRALDTWRAALAALHTDPAATVPAAALGRIEAALDDRAVRDAVLLTLLAVPDGLAEDLLRHARGDLGSAGASWSAPGEPGLDGDPDDPDGAGAAGEGGARCSPLERAGDALGDAEADPRAQDDAAAAAGDDAAPRGAGSTPPCGAGSTSPCGADDASPCGADVTGTEGADDPPGTGEGTRAPGGGDLRPTPGPAGRAPDAGPRTAADVDADVRSALDALLDPGCAREPDEALVDAGRSVLEAVVAHGRTGRQAPALTLLALLAWWDGDGVRASVLVERALAQDPGHRLAELVDRVLGAGLAPAWLRRRC